jgi:predicted DNA-binding ribbon-helix-helix protein
VRRFDWVVSIGMLGHRVLHHVWEDERTVLAMRSVTKRSISVAKHKTSISVDDVTWAKLRTIAKELKLHLGALVHAIDHSRDRRIFLSDAVRRYVSAYLKELQPWEQSVGWHAGRLEETHPAVTAVMPSAVQGCGRMQLLGWIVIAVPVIIVSLIAAAHWCGVIGHDRGWDGMHVREHSVNA